MLSKNSLTPSFIELHSVESTNNYAMGLLHAAMAPHGTAVFAHEQTKGKGQRNKEWQSEPGKNIILSVVIEPKGLTTSQLFLFNMAITVACKMFCSEITNGDIKIKWPNDIYWRDRKAGGILIENNIQSGKWNYAVVGIGINCNQVQFGELQQKAVSLKQITGKDFDPVLLSKKLCADVINEFNLLLEDSDKIINSYRENIYKLNEKVRLKKDARIFDAVVKDVSTNGHLIVQHTLEETFNVGEVEWVGI